MDPDIPINFLPDLFLKLDLYSKMPNHYFLYQSLMVFFLKTALKQLNFGKSTFFYFKVTKPLLFALISPIFAHFGHQKQKFYNNSWRCVQMTQKYQTTWLGQYTQQPLTQCQIFSSTYIWLHIASWVDSHSIASIFVFFLC